eukprot:m.151041 g.151041  ORF g.151041 m.151041 type:complete len:456 (+) comp9754_c0_seq6:1617-2984(+)
MDKMMTQLEKFGSEAVRAAQAGSSIQEAVQGVCDAVEGIMGMTGATPRDIAKLHSQRSSLLDLARMPGASPDAIRNRVQGLADVAERMAAAFIPQAEARELCVMNNYMGIGLDAKIALDFNTLREVHPDKCRSRLRNQMWYGVLGGRELVTQSCRNLNKSLVLECDGQVVELPRLQGIVVLNIASYMGGTNFWGTKTDKAFRPPAPDDGLLEVVAVSGTAQMAACKTLPGMTPTRLAQARVVRITVTGSASVPLQVDGEAWMQAPCVVTITHKNRMLVMSRDRELHERLVQWTPPRQGSADHLDALLPLLQMMGQIESALTDGNEDEFGFDVVVNEKIAGLLTGLTLAREQASDYKDIHGFFQACSALLTCLRTTDSKIDADLLARGEEVLQETVARFAPSRTLRSRPGSPKSPHRSFRSMMSIFSSSPSSTAGSAVSLSSLSAEATPLGGEDNA